MSRGDPALQAKMARILPLLHLKMRLSDMPPASKMPPEMDKNGMIDELVGALIGVLDQVILKEPNS